MAYDLPAAPKISGQTFQLNRVQARNPSRGGQHQVVDLGEPLWSAQVQTTPLTASQAGQYDALFAKLRGGARTAYVYDAKRPRPIAYLNTADATGAAIGVTTRKIGLTTRKIGVGAKPWGYPRVIRIYRTFATIDLNNCRAGAVFSPGDYLAFDDGPARRLHIVVESATADASGLVTLIVEPAPPRDDAAMPSNAATFEKAAAEMILVANEQPWRVGQSSAASFSAVQVLRRY